VPLNLPQGGCFWIGGKVGYKDSRRGAGHFERIGARCCRRW